MHDACDNDYSIEIWGNYDALPGNIAIAIYMSRCRIGAESELGAQIMLSKTAEYALRIAVCLANSPDNPASADELAEITKIPRRYLHKVVQGLAREGLVRSQPGPGGGYSI